MHGCVGRFDNRMAGIKNTGAAGGSPVGSNTRLLYWKFLGDFEGQRQFADLGVSIAVGKRMLRKRMEQGRARLHWRGLRIEAQEAAGKSGIENHGASF